ncbi:unnamed protein product, partial [Prorocentrum cordatum]
RPRPAPPPGRAMAPAAGAPARGPVQDQLEQLDSIFGAAYFEHGRLVVTVARDLTGCMKVAHKIISKCQERFGAMVDVVTEHVKHESWVKLHEHSKQAKMAHGAEVPEYQVTKIPDGIRIPPYARESLPTLEFLLLWEEPQSLAAHRDRPGPITEAVPQPRGHLGANDFSMGLQTGSDRMCYRGDWQFLVDPKHGIGGSIDTRARPGFKLVRDDV